MDLTDCRTQSYFHSGLNLEVEAATQTVNTHFSLCILYVFCFSRVRGCDSAMFVMLRNWT